MPTGNGESAALDSAARSADYSISCGHPMAEPGKTCQPFQLLRQLKSEIQVSISWHADLVVAGDLVPRGDRADGADTPGN